MARTGEYLSAPYTSSFHVVEFLQTRGKWLYPDFGELDYAKGDYHEMFLGGGRTLIDGKKFTLLEELFFDQAVGPTAKGANYLWPWTRVDLRFTPRLTSQTVYFPYLPLSSSGRFQQEIERSKLEYVLNRSWKGGIGYGSYQEDGSAWQNREFVTATVATRAGEFEFWLQKIPGHGSHLQLRYTLALSNSKH